MAIRDLAQVGAALRTEWVGNLSRRNKTSVINRCWK
jgi:hypothetical protein